MERPIPLLLLVFVTLLQCQSLVAAADGDRIPNGQGILSIGREATSQQKVSSITCMLMLWPEKSLEGSPYIHESMTWQNGSRLICNSVVLQDTQIFKKAQSLFFKCNCQGLPAGQTCASMSHAMHLKLSDGKYADDSQATKLNVHFKPKKCSGTSCEWLVPDLSAVLVKREDGVEYYDMLNKITSFKVCLGKVEHTPTPSKISRSLPPHPPVPAEYGGGKCHDPQAVLAQHNQFRRQHMETDDLQWDIDLASDAQLAADNLVQTAKGCKQATPTGTAVGELSFLWRENSIDQPKCHRAVLQWYSGSSSYNYNLQPYTSNKDSIDYIRGFAQVVWKSSSYVGCGIASSGAAQGMRCFAVVCKYKEPGLEATDKAWKANVRVMKQPEEDEKKPGDLDWEDPEY